MPLLCNVEEHFTVQLSLNYMFHLKNCQYAALATRVIVLSRSLDPTTTFASRIPVIKTDIPTSEILDKSEYSNVKNKSQKDEQRARLPQLKRRPS